MSDELTREQMAEKVGYYFGLQRAGNHHPHIPDPSGDGARMLNALRQWIDNEMAKMEAELPRDAIERWPNV